jgi:hypothetical protein
MGAVGLLVVLGVLAVRPPALSPAAGPTQSAEPTNGTVVSPAGTDPVDVSIAPTTPHTSEVTIGPTASSLWASPGPDATVPPGVPVISGLLVDDLVGAWESVGLRCESWNVGPPGGGGGYTLHCERVDAGNNVEYLAEAIYFTQSGVTWVSMQVSSVSHNLIDGTPAARELFLSSVELAGGPTAREWVQARVVDASCRSECRTVIAGARFMLTMGLRGGQHLYVVADGPP